jgi:hypothetical protein
MKLTLRKANTIQHSINEKLKSLELTTTVALNEFEETSPQIEAVRQTFFKNYFSRNKLTLALFEIRQKVANANASSGINDLLTKVALLEKQQAFLTMLSGKGSQVSLRVLNGQLKRNAEMKGESYSYHRNEVTTPIFTDEEIEQFRREAAEFKRQKQKIQDNLLELNVRTEIELETDTADFLKSHDIV